MVCNTKFNNVQEVPCFIHNLNYDSHLFIKELALYESKYNLEIIPSTTEKYIGISKKISLSRPQNYKPVEDPTLNITFKDSFRFVN